MKRHKGSVHYERPARHPETVCGNCTHRELRTGLNGRSYYACGLVRGVISKAAWCELWEKHTGDLQKKALHVR